MASGLSGMSNLIKNFNFGSFAGVGWLIGKTLLWLGAMLAVFLFVWKRSKYNIEVIIYTRRGDSSLMVERDVGGFVKTKDGREVFALWGKKINLPPPNSKFIMLNSKGKGVIHLYKYGIKDYAPIFVYHKIMKDNKDIFSFKPVEQDMAAWAVQERKADADKFTKPNFWKEHGAQITLLGGMVLIMVMLYMALGNIAKLGAYVTQAANIMADATKTMSKCIVTPAIGGVPPGT